MSCVLDTTVNFFGNRNTAKIGMFLLVKVVNWNSKTGSGYREHQSVGYNSFESPFDNSKKRTIGFYLENGVAVMTKTINGV